MVHDPLDMRDMAADELEEAKISGRAVPASLAAQIPVAVAADDSAELFRLFQELSQLPLVPDWRYLENYSVATVVEHLGQVAGSETAPLNLAEMAPKFIGAWEGRILGCTLGKPVEGMSKAEISSYLQYTGANLAEDFLPWETELPEDMRPLNGSANVSTRGNIEIGPRDDDLDYTVLGLHMLEKYGLALSAADVAHEWLEKLPFLQVYTAERVTYRNLIQGHAPEHAAGVVNPYREWIGALIRADVYGYVYPGQPARAAALAARDASLSHIGNGIAGASWAAALIALCFTADSLADAVQESLKFTVPETRLAQVLADTVEMYHAGKDWTEFSAWLERDFSAYSWVHTNNNAALIAGSLLWGEGDYLQSVALCVAQGLDTDSAAATVGSALGAHRPESLPRALVAQFNGNLSSAVQGYHQVKISDLAERTRAVAHQFAAHNEAK